MKTIAKALITTFIIFSIATLAGERETRINLAIQPVSETEISILEDARSYQLDMTGNKSDCTGTGSRIVSRKKTVSR